jgi:transcriptional regulator with XRE-family HTH domain
MLVPIRKLRRAAGLSVEALARAAGLNAATVKRCEAGQRVSSDTRWRLTLACKHALDSRAQAVHEAQEVLSLNPVTQ